MPTRLPGRCRQVAVPVVVLALVAAACSHVGGAEAGSRGVGGTTTTVSTVPGIAVTIPDNALDHPLAITAADTLPAEGVAGSHNLDLSFVLAAEGTQPEAALEVVAEADQLNPTDPELVYLARWDETYKTWVPVPTRYEPTTGRYVATIDHLSLFAFWEWGNWEDIGTGIKWTARQVKAAFDNVLGFVQGTASTVGSVLGGAASVTGDWLGLAGVDPPTCQTAPKDITVSLSDSGANGVIRACVDQTADGHTIARIANNRPYGLVVALPDGAAADITSWPGIDINGQAAMYTFYTALPFLNEAYIPPSAEIAVTVDAPTGQTVTLEATSTPAFVGVDMAAAWLLVFYGGIADIASAADAVSCISHAGGSLTDYAHTGSANPLTFLEGTKSCLEALGFNVGTGVLGNLLSAAKATIAAVPALVSSIIDTDFTRFEVREAVTLASISPQVVVDYSTYPDSWAQALVDAANAGITAPVDSYPGASIEAVRTFLAANHPYPLTLTPCSLGALSGRLVCWAIDGHGTDWAIDFNSGSAGESFVNVTRTVYFPRTNPPERNGFYDSYSTIAPDGAYGSGCTPGSGQLPDGDWYGRVRDLHTPGQLSFDLACLLPSDEYDDVEVNNNKTLRTVAVPAFVTVTAVFDSPEEVVPWDQPFDKWRQGRCANSGCPVWLHIRNGKLAHITEYFSQ